MRVAGLTVILLAVMAVAPLGGCKSDSGANPNSSGPQPQKAGQVIGSDPCAIQLQEIGGALLYYYAVHHVMPENLQELAPHADVGAPLQFVCPKSGLPYVYSPNGLLSAGRSKRIIVYDAEPSHGGARWCIFADPRGNNSSISVEVLLVDEKTFKTFEPTILP